MPPAEELAFEKTVSKLYCILFSVQCTWWLYSTFIPNYLNKLVAGSGECPAKFRLIDTTSYLRSPI